MTETEVAVAGPTGPLKVRLYRPGGPSDSPSPLVRGSREPVIFIHPVNTGAGVWAHVASAIADQRMCLVPDLRGHGRSTQVGPFGAMDYAADVLAVLDHFGLERAHLVGGSIGGPVSVLLAALQPERVLSIASFGGALELRIGAEVLAEIRKLLDQGVDELFRTLIPSALGARHRTDALVERAVAIALGTGRSAALVYEIIDQAFHTDVSEFAARCRVASLVVNGSEDLTCTAEDGRRMALALGSVPMVLDGAGHLPMLEAPCAVAALLKDHWNEHF